MEVQLPPPVRKRKLSVYSLVPLATHPSDQLATQPKPSLSFPPQSLPSGDAKATVQGLQIRENELSFTPPKSPVDLLPRLRVASRATPSGRAWYSVRPEGGMSGADAAFPAGTGRERSEGGGLGASSAPGPRPLLVLALHQECWPRPGRLTDLRPQRESHTFAQLPGAALHSTRGVGRARPSPRS